MPGEEDLAAEEAGREFLLRLRVHAALVGSVLFSEVIGWMNFRFSIGRVLVDDHVIDDLECGRVAPAASAERRSWPGDVLVGVSEVMRMSALLLA
jgi:hypothetical protein